MPGKNARSGSLALLLVLAVVALVWLSQGCASSETIEERLAREGGMEFVLALDTRDLPAAERDHVGPRAADIFRERCKMMGLTHFSVDLEEGDRLRVRLVGDVNPRSLPAEGTRMGLVELRFVAAAEEYAGFLEGMSRAMAESDGPDSADPLGRWQRVVVDDTSLPGHTNLWVYPADRDTVRVAVENTKTLDLLPPGVDLLWSHAPLIAPGGMSLHCLYLVHDTTLLNGASIAEVSLEADSPGGPGVVLRFTPEGKEKLASITASSVGRRICLVLDDEVYLAAPLQEPITRGELLISGNLSDLEARGLAVALRGGVFPAPSEVVLSRVVSPSGG